MLVVVKKVRFFTISYDTNKTNCGDYWVPWLSREWHLHIHYCKRLAGTDGKAKPEVIRLMMLAVLTAQPGGYLRPVSSTYSTDHLVHGLWRKHYSGNHVLRPITSAVGNSLSARYGSNGTHTGVEIPPIIRPEQMPLQYLPRSVQR